MKNAPFALFLLVAVSCQQCSKKPVVETLLKEGEICQSDDRCETGLCDAPPGVQAVCVRKCANGCYEGEVCTQLTPNRFSCQLDQRKLCQPCLVDGDCPYPSDRCVVVNGEKVCGRDCAFDQSCPMGYQCVNARGIDGTPKLQQCTPVNASCACLARGDFRQPCETSNAFGTCKGTRQCDLIANTVVCDAKEPAAESCNGADDDCNGKVDDGLMAVSCGVGACKRTAGSCEADGGAATCTPGTPTAELCNGLDDDCDGMVDNGFPVETDPNNCGACGHVCTLAHATSDCVSRDCQVASCETGWGNCDGQHPNGCETDVTTDAMNCGACGRACARPNSTATCAGAKCQFQCAPGFYDLNGDPADGCEYACTFVSATDLPDLSFTDANCDGIDGEVANGIFVSPSGNNNNSGTRTAPKLGINSALVAAATQGKRDVYVAAGNYLGPVEFNLASNVNLAGGYHPLTWRRDVANVVTVQGGNPALKLDGATNVLVQTMRFVGANAVASGASAYGAQVKDSTNVMLQSLVITAGNGADGARGADGVAGARGGAGGEGMRSCVYDTRPGSNIPWECLVTGAFAIIHVCDQATGPTSGPGGTSGCGFPGGAGGQPSHMVGGDTASDAVAPGSAGGAAPNGSGAGGEGVPGRTIPSGPPYFGEAGTPGAPGANGAAAAEGRFTATGWVPGRGGNGARGTDGRGGGGGGGGAGGWVPLFNVAGTKCQAFGSGGGGGGGGGCGGTGGRGGEGGGAAIGLFVSGASTVVGQGVFVNTGRAGNGGGGGYAGAPGPGGPAGDSPGSLDSGSRAVPGGKGGAGGNGGAGGVGGGGAGGSVFGIARSSAATVTGVMVGTLGPRGLGGIAPASGPNGTSAPLTTF